MEYFEYQTITKEELYRFHLDNVRRVDEYRARKQKKHDAKFPLKTQAISLMLAASVPVFSVASYA